MDGLTEAIKKQCLEAGFIKVGFAEAAELKFEKKYLREWLDENRNAEMKWMNDSFEKRINPKLIFENVKSVISLAYLYDTPVAHSDDHDVPKISRYAWGEGDYHRVIKKRLKILCPAIESLSPGIKTRYYIDDGPVMDKVWALKAGIGWLSKNTNIVDQDIGSFFFLASIFTNIELAYDTPVNDLCKSCSLCVEACPTGALFEEYKLDANLCISYHTIENRQEIPNEINLNGWIFGCDICQDVCPYNSRKTFTEDVNFYPRKDFLHKTYDELLQMTEDDFNGSFKSTPVKRTKYNGWKRNIIKFQNDIKMKS